MRRMRVHVSYREAKEGTSYATLVNVVLRTTQNGERYPAQSQMMTPPSQEVAKTPK